MAQFVQLTVEDCDYLLNLIEEMDSDTLYTERQRRYTVPKLQRIKNDPRSARLAWQDVEYLLDLMEDDDLPELEQQREMTKAAVRDIQMLQEQHTEIVRSIENQRASRRAKRNPAKVLQEHFAQTKAAGE